MLELISFILEKEWDDWRQNQRRDISGYSRLISVSAMSGHFECFLAWINGVRDGLTRNSLKDFASL